MYLITEWQSPHILLNLLIIRKGVPACVLINPKATAGFRISQTPFRPLQCSVEESSRRIDEVLYHDAEQMIFNIPIVTASGLILVETISIYRFRAPTPNPLLAQAARIEFRITTTLTIRSNLLVNQDIEQVDNLFIITNFTIQPSKIQVQLKAFWGRLKMGMRIGDENEHPKEVWKEY
ncbi:hypothetical protein DCAR_0934769 [Daucus carota subsp. sativus]|uniref:Uncharacterized protein n=1 Tax=Daucus carota subsp. sativus TaxID=79200 RepID=A0A175YFH6_DAUCS|nr:hypothetical protein DCAR_0934769 [Daucus carota subsp. sativus]